MFQKSLTTFNNMEEAIKLTDAIVKGGRLIPVYNKGKQEKKTHFLAIWVEDHTGENERCLLFTQAEIEKAEKRALQNPEDIPKKTLLIDILD